MIHQGIEVRKVSDIIDIANYCAFFLCIIQDSVWINKEQGIKKLLNATSATVIMGLHTAEDGTVKQPRKDSVRIKKHCSWCGKEFYGANTNRKNAYCPGGTCSSIKIYWAAKGVYTLAERNKLPPTKKKPKQLICTHCGVRYMGYEQMKNGNRFCSGKCGSHYHMAKKKAEKEKKDA